MNETKKDFLRELRELFRKYSIKIDSYSDYDGNDEYIGTYYVLEGKGDIHIEISDLEAKIKNG